MSGVKHYKWVRLVIAGGWDEVHQAGGWNNTGG